MPQRMSVSDFIRGGDVLSAPTRPVPEPGIGQRMSVSEFYGAVNAAGKLGELWANEDINSGDVTPETFMQRASDRIQEYQTFRDRAGSARLTANEQVALVDAYREMAGLQPEGFYRTVDGSAVPEDIFAARRQARMEDDSWENFKSNISSTALHNINGIRAAGARITDALGISEGATAQAAREGEEINRILAPQGGASGFSGQAVGNMMNLFLGGWASAPARFATSTAGSTFLEVARRRETGQEISVYDEWTAAIANAGIEYTLEKFGQSVARKAGMRLAGGIGRIRLAVTQGGTRKGLRVAGSILETGLNVAGQQIQGGAEEGITQILQNTANRLTFAKDQNIFAGVGDAALQGLVMPLMAAGPLAAIHGGGRADGVDGSGRPRPPVPMASMAMAEQQIRTSRPLAKQALVERALKSEDALPESLKPALPDEAEIPSVAENTTVSEAGLTDKWIGDRQLAEVRADINSRNAKTDLGGLLRDGETLAQVDDALAVYIDMQNNPDSYSAENILGLSPELQTLVERAQSLSPEQQAFGDRLIAENAALGLEAMDAGIIKNIHDNYSARFWKKSLTSGAGKAKFTTSTGRARQRTLPSLIEGWQRGLQLDVTGAIDAQRLARQQIAQVIHDRNFVKLGEKAGLFSEDRSEELPVRIEHPNFAVWKWKGKAEEGKIYGSKDTFIDGDGNIRQRVVMYADPKMGKFLNNVLGSSALFNIPGVGTITKYNSIIKHMVLTAALFHHQAYLRSFMLASRGVNPVTAYRAGREAIENFVPELQELVHEGLTIGKVLDFTLAGERESTIIGNVIDKVPMASGVRKALRALSRKNSEILFQKLGPYLKVQAGLLDYRHQLQKQDKAIREGKITRQEIAKNVSNNVNDDFGGLNLQRMGRNPTAQHIFRLLSLAPDWTESNVRSMVKAFKTGHEGKVYREMWGRVAMKGIGTTILFNAIMSGLNDEDDFIKQYKRAWDSGNLRWLDVDITPLLKAVGLKPASRKYFSLIGHFRDPVKFIIEPPRSIKGKSSILGRMITEMIVGTDWKGREFTSFGELLRTGEAVAPHPFGGGPINPLQFPSFILKQAEQSTPVQVQSLIQWQRGEMDAFDAITRGAGMHTSTAPKPKRKIRKIRKQPTRRK